LHPPVAKTRTMPNNRLTVADFKNFPITNTMQPGNGLDSIFFPKTSFKLDNFLV
jgi:hypothetical protein